ncbi:uncharacterized protein E0L32_003181 [Thyridium curvatum]|uniref:Uncharacterized protein n=1 Tax=Thyridium curvatum TaxID=1093900 RepID=A0A507BLJ0_9PEZI|nr:uncharacterized protein E0L32_003181 [Thyridium curvatum]TPX17538.1 hypothetical protein E0L32_003181 [Thyridium curvatum]
MRTLLLSPLLFFVGEVAAACSSNNCLRAVRKEPTKDRNGTADCLSYFQATVTPATRADGEKPQHNLQHNDRDSKQRDLEPDHCHDRTLPPLGSSTRGRRPPLWHISSGRSPGDSDRDIASQLCLALLFGGGVLVGMLVHEHTACYNHGLDAADDAHRDDDCVSFRE